MNASNGPDWKNHPISLKVKELKLDTTNCIVRFKVEFSEFHYWGQAKTKERSFRHPDGQWDIVHQIDSIYSIYSCESFDMETLSDVKDAVNNAIVLINE